LINLSAMIKHEFPLTEAVNSGTQLFSFPLLCFFSNLILGIKIIRPYFFF
jgi:hypothetical protein